MDDYCVYWHEDDGRASSSRVVKGSTALYGLLTSLSRKKLQRVVVEGWSRKEGYPTFGKLSISALREMFGDYLPKHIKWV